MGAEIGNSTQKLHARGPIGLRELTTFKYVGPGRRPDTCLRTGSDARRIGVFGSAFNPPQKAHLSLVVEAAIAQLGLDRLIVVPTGDAYHKDPESDPGPEARCALARGGFRRASTARRVSPVEVDREGPSYTYVTLERIAGDNPDSEIHLLMGADTASGFGGWKRPERILELARVAVVARRPDVSREEVEVVFEAAGGLRPGRPSSRCPRSGPFLEPGPRADRGGTAGRAAWCPPAVAEMINNEGVYGSEQ